MSRPKRLTREQWKKIRATWEADKREGYAWAVREMDLPVSRAAVSKRAKAEGWEKKPAKTAASQRVKGVVQEVTEKVTGKVAQVTPATKKVTQQVAPATNPIGRPSAYRPEFADQAYRLMMMGFTRERLAEFFQVATSTLYDWQSKHVEFREALYRGGLYADSEVALSLFDRAVGSVTPDTHVAVIDGQVVMTPVDKHYPPDVGAARMWLKNRQPEMWKDKVEVEERVEVALVNKEELDQLYREALAKAAETEKRLAGRAERLGLIIDHDDGEIDG